MVSSLQILERSVLEGDGPVWGIWAANYGQLLGRLRELG